jgi:alpha-L-rhamnosidase
MNRFVPIFLSCLVAVPGVLSAASEFRPENLRCESRANPLGIDLPNPRLSWTLSSPSRGRIQTAYRILVASSATALARGEVDLWDSGRVDSTRLLQIAYRGEPLTSGLACFWKVRVWDAQGEPSRWSEPARWEMGLLDPEDWTGHWIGDGRQYRGKDEDFCGEDPAPLLRRSFSITRDVARARLFISGLGYYEASLNGRRVGDSVLDPGWTAFDKRVFYSTYDVTGLFRPGENVLGVTLGNGWYNPLPLKMWGRLNLREHLVCGRPRLMAQLKIEFVDGASVSIVSNETWKVAEGPILRNNIYLGEVYDARKKIVGWDRPGFDDSTWRAASLVTEPVGDLQAQPQPPVKVTAEIEPVALTEPKPGVFIFDMGQNFAGWVRLRFAAPAGSRITLRYGELLNEDGTLNPLTSVCGQIKGSKEKSPRSDDAPWPPPVAWQGDVVIARGGSDETWRPRFTYHAFRYLEVTGLPARPDLDMVRGLRLNAAVEEVGSFECSDETLNAIHRMCRRTFLSNLFSVQSDCPHRERFGYGGDIVASCDALMLNFDMAAFYAKTVCDWADAARDDGMLTDTAPFVGIQYCGVGWAMVHPFLLNKLYQYYGDRRLIEEQYAVSRRWLDLVTVQYPEHIVEQGLSDHEGLAPSPSGPMVTPLFAESARLVARLAGILGRSGEERKYTRLADSIRQAYIEKYLDVGSGRFGPGTQASQVFALSVGGVPPESRAAALGLLLADIGEHDGHLSTGILGTKFLLDVLSREGYARTAYGMVTRKTFPGWGFMLENGATTLWEHWAFSDNTFSHNHPMFGSVSEWFYKWLGGIQPHPEAVGFDRIVIRPQIIDELDWVEASYRSARGPIACSWKRTGKTVVMDVTIPPNTRASVHVPAQRLDDVRAIGPVVGGKMGAHSEKIPAAKAEGVRSARLVGQEAVLEVEPGRYRFVTTRDSIQSGEE